MSSLLGVKPRVLRLCTYDVTSSRQRLPIIYVPEQWAFAAFAGVAHTSGVVTWLIANSDGPLLIWLV